MMCMVGKMMSLRPSLDEDDDMIWCGLCHPYGDRFVGLAGGNGTCSCDGEERQQEGVHTVVQLM